MGWIIFLCVVSQEGKCKLGVLSSVSALVYKLFREEKAQFGYTVILLEPLGVRE